MGIVGFKSGGRNEILGDFPETPSIHSASEGFKNSPISLVKCLPRMESYIIFKKGLKNRVILGGNLGMKLWGYQWDWRQFHEREGNNQGEREIFKKGRSRVILGENRIRGGVWRQFY